MFNKGKILILEKRIEELEKFKYEYDLNIIKMNVGEKISKLEKKYKIKLGIREYFHSIFSFTSPCLVINILKDNNYAQAQVIRDCKNSIEYYKKINFADLEDKIKVYLFDKKKEKEEIK
jgi:hypothetical protein